MSRTRNAHGAVLLLALVLIACIAASFAVLAVAARAATARDRATQRALAQAREALIAYAVDRPINAATGPGYLPCPDLDGDGWAESTCGSLDGATGQASRLGLLPWKTLGLPELRDGAGERLWYAVSTRYKGLLNCAASSACVDMTPAHALGTITVRAADGTVIHDGTASTGAAAVVIAPGPPLERIEADGAHLQQRACAPGDCDSSGVCIASPPQRAAPCDPRNFLDRAPGAPLAEDNADFVDRSDAAGRAQNGNGFITGPVHAGDRTAVNDRLAVIAYDDVMPRIMARVALEVAQCVRFYGTRPENGGRYPAPVAACGRGPRFGTLPDTPFDGAASGMLARWWRAVPRAPESLAELPTHDDACRLAVAPDDPGPVRTYPPGMPSSEGETADAPSWWRAWRPLVYASVATAHAPSDAPNGSCTAGGTCVRLVGPDAHALREAQSAAIIVSPTCPASDVCANDDCSTVIVSRNPRELHAVVAIP